MRLRADTMRQMMRSPMTGKEYVRDRRDALSVEKKMDVLLAANVDFGGDVTSIFADADRIQGANCHKTALFLAGKIGWNELFDMTNHDVDEAGHVYVYAQTNLLKGQGGIEENVRIALRLLLKQTMPQRVSFFQITETGVHVAHSITVTHVSDGRLRGFDKVDAHADQPFRKIDVQEVIALYVGLGYRVGFGV
jgi:hypothetical protein